MKNLLLLTLLMISYLSFSQSTFYPGTLTKNDGSKETVYFKNKEYVIDSNGELNIYQQESDESKIIISANDFTEIVSHNDQLLLETTVIKELKSTDKVILKKLVEGDNNLYLIRLEENNYYVDQKNGIYTLLEKRKSQNINSIIYKEWLFNNFNPSNLMAVDFSRISYDQDDLVEYYTDNNPNGNELTLENRVKPINISILGNYVNNDISLKTASIAHENINSSNIKIGLNINYNIDKLENRVTAFGGLNYYTSIDGQGNSVVFPESDIQRRNAVNPVEFNYWSFNLGVQYNINFNRFSLSPYLSYESLYLTSDNRIAAIFEDGTTFYDSSNFIKDPTAINLGFKVTAFKNIIATVEYSYLTDIATKYTNGLDSQIIEAKINRLSIGIGYKIF
ncbi:hypothetical protein [Nonlabens sp. Asnod2-A12]|uniref:hypothetical protein n=1 Tax=Nonlabens sp. Asnod2-A12 TaxID=3160578 RepID=UPI00386A9A3A